MLQDLHELIEWHKFQLVLEESVGADADSLSKLKPLIGSYLIPLFSLLNHIITAHTAVLEGVDVLCVSMARFHQFVQWFGAFYDVAGKSRLEEVFN